MKKTVLGMMLALLLIGVLTLASDIQPVKADWTLTETIYIRADGSIDPPTANITSADNVTYFFTDNNYDSIYVERDNIVVDGADHVLRGAGEGPGIYLSGIGNVTIKNVEIKAFWFGIELHDALNDNTICGNAIADNVIGISLYRSSDNTVSGNNVTGNTQYGIRVGSSSNNIIYHNNFVDNAEQVYSMNATSVWDDGYPSGGNYWSGYADVDQHSGPYQDQAESDGIWDHQYDIADLFFDNQDNYPLVGPISFFNAGTWDETTYYVHTVSNSTVSDFYFNPDEGAVIRFNVTGSDGTTGFSRVAIPKQLLWVENGWVVLVGDEPVVPSVTEDADYTYLYFTYSHSTKTVEVQGTQVIPEFPTWTSILLILIAVTVALAIYKRRLLKTPIH